MQRESVRPDVVDDSNGDWPLTDGLFETLRLTAAPGTPERPPSRRGHPSLAEPPQQVVFTPSWPLRLRLDPDGQPFIQNEWWWRQKPEVPPCRLVWIGEMVPSSGPHTTPHVQALVHLFSSPPGAFSVIQLPSVSLPLLSVGRVLKAKSGHAESRRSLRDGPGYERRFLGNEWSVDVWFGSGAERITTAGAATFTIATLAEHPHFADSPLYVLRDPAARRVVAIPCWEIFRAYYGAPLVARLILEFPGRPGHLSSSCRPSTGTVLSEWPGGAQAPRRRRRRRGFKTRTPGSSCWRSAGKRRSPTPRRVGRGFGLGRRVPGR